MLKKILEPKIFLLPQNVQVQEYVQALWTLWLELQQAPSWLPEFAQSRESQVLQASSLRRNPTPNGALYS